MWDLSLQFVRLSSCGPQAHGLCSCSSRALQLWHWGLVALAMWDLRSLTMYGACISCTGRWILNHWKSPPWRFRLILPESVLPEKQEAIKQEIYREMFNIKINLVIPQYKIKRLKKKKKKGKLVTSLVVQWLRLHTPNARDPGSIPGHGTKIPYATASKDPLLTPGGPAPPSQAPVCTPPAQGPTRARPHQPSLPTMGRPSPPPLPLVPLVRPSPKSITSPRRPKGCTHQSPRLRSFIIDPSVPLLICSFVICVPAAPKFQHRNSLGASKRAWECGDLGGPGSPTKSVSRPHPSGQTR